MKAMIRLNTLRDMRPRNLPISLLNSWLIHCSKSVRFTQLRGTSISSASSYIFHATFYVYGVKHMTDFSETTNMNTMHSSMWLPLNGNTSRNEHNISYLKIAFIFAYLLSPISYQIFGHFRTLSSRASRPTSVWQTKFGPYETGDNRVWIIPHG